MHARRIILPLQRLGGTENRHTVTPAYSRFWSCISGHFEKCELIGLDAALFWRATTVMRDWSNIADHSEIEPDCLQSAHRRLTTGSGPSYQDFDFFQAVSHCLSRSILRNH